jgi:hypothetical protein
MMTLYVTEQVAQRCLTTSGRRKMKIAARERMAMLWLWMVAMTMVMGLEGGRPSFSRSSVETPKIRVRVKIMGLIIVLLQPVRVRVVPS